MVPPFLLFKFKVMKEYTYRHEGHSFEIKAEKEAAGGDMVWVVTGYDAAGTVIATARDRISHWAPSGHHGAAAVQRKIRKYLRENAEAAQAVTTAAKVAVEAPQAAAAALESGKLVLHTYTPGESEERALPNYLEINTPGGQQFVIYVKDDGILVVTQQALIIQPKASGFVLLTTGDN